MLRDRLTIVLLTFNCAHRIMPVLEHLRKWDVPVVVVDNGSRDDTVSLIRKEHLLVIDLPSNIGAAARNVGAELAGTPYVAFCDDDGWWEQGLDAACDLLDQYPQLCIVNARIQVGNSEYLDPISTEMEQSPVPDRSGIPGVPILSFMAGAVVARVEAFLAVGGYDPRFFMGGEEETVAIPLAKTGGQMRYIPELVMHHQPSLANASNFRALGMRNTIVNAWLHRRLKSAVRWTVFTLADTPKNHDYVKALGMILAALPWILNERKPMSKELDSDLALLDTRRFAARRPIFSSKAWRPEDVREATD